MASNNAAKKKMSLEEFLDDSSLNDSAWNENEIDLSAISTTLSNTTSLDLLKSAAKGHGGHGGGDYGGGFSNGSHFHGSGRQYDPPYIIKFSNLQKSFSNHDIEDLFRTKFTRFVKFKMFWELNRSPPLDSDSLFDKCFTKNSKVAFVEVYSFRDMDKIMSQWREPLMELHAIKVEPAEFSDFQNYVNKDKALPSGSPDAGKLSSTGPGGNPKHAAQPAKPKVNPFGDAKPVDTQTKILKIEETVQKFHIEDTTALRKLSFGDSSPEGKKVTLLKREGHSKGDSHAIDDEEIEEPAPKARTSNATASAAKPEASKPRLTYSEVLQKAAKERDDAAAASIASIKQSSPLISPAALDATGALAPRSASDQSKRHGDNKDEFNDTQSSRFVFKDGADPHRGSFRGSGRGNFRGGRGGGTMRKSASRSGHRGNHEGRGGHHSHSRDSGFENGTDGNSKSYERHDGDGGNSTGRHYGNDRRHNDGHRGQNVYSLFRPAAGFLGDSGNTGNGGARDNNRGGRGGRGRGRGRGAH
ncbi:AER332Wp [Eremothecium gossypii ATCC 10895]|uniref:AER332Wp n=1 Tax=Eremothecium gossypii (strain ATCC 10895 / CBS 109.51 / FGSC 9923 / NRRL Y-1056) TaxID=284811 RepID=Q756D5_EREGS|nr:AER332Wp [Eremothecium gossypii ATCC 10895]AAS53012.2 AER332Wp [Eremothecium gossypii ATCC 10895]